jgi:hypothetical protein
MLYYNLIALLFIGGFIGQFKEVNTVRPCRNINGKGPLSILSKNGLPDGV